MPTIFVKGDLFADQQLPAFGHGCNCAGAMGKGIAVEFRKRFPRMYEEYRTRCQDGRFQLGDVFVWSEFGKTIFNLGTQKTWRTKAELSAIQQSITKMLQLANDLMIDQIGIPKIGAGLGGLSWDQVKKLLQDIGANSETKLIVFEEFIPG